MSYSIKKCKKNTYNNSHKASYYPSHNEQNWCVTIQINLDSSTFYLTQYMLIPYYPIFWIVNIGSGI